MANIKGCLMHDSDEWETPKSLFKELDDLYHFDLDLCANASNTKCDNYCDHIETVPNLTGHRIWCNPPYSQLSKFIAICYTLSLHGNFVVMLIPARTDTLAFHTFIYRKKNVSIEFLKGRLKFEKNGVPQKSAPFPSMLVRMGKL